MSLFQKCRETVVRALSPSTLSCILFPQYVYPHLPSPKLIDIFQLSEIANVTSLLPGTLVQSLITAVVPSGLNLQVLGFFEGTVDQVHLSPGKKYKIGQKVKARVLYDISGTSPPRFALALVDHIIGLDVKRATGENSKDRPNLQEAYPVGKIIDVKVTGVEPERGLMAEVEPDAGVQGFVHVN